MVRIKITDTGYEGLCIEGALGSVPAKAHLDSMCSSRLPFFTAFAGSDPLTTGRVAVIQEEGSLTELFILKKSFPRVGCYSDNPFQEPDESMLEIVARGNNEMMVHYLVDDVLQEIPEYTSFDLSQYARNKYTHSLLPHFDFANMADYFFSLHTHYLHAMQAYERLAPRSINHSDIAQLVIDGLNNQGAEVKRLGSTIMLAANSWSPSNKIEIGYIHVQSPDYGPAVIGVAAFNMWSEDCDCAYNATCDKAYSYAGYLFGGKHFFFGGRANHRTPECRPHTQLFEDIVPLSKRKRVVGERLSRMDLPPAHLQVIESLVCETMIVR